MDGLAKMVGLDIEAIAIQVATKDSWDEEQRPRLDRGGRGIDSISSSPEAVKPLAKPVTKAVAPTPTDDIFSPEKINNAFANLFSATPASDTIMDTPSFLEK